ncbi:MAG: hypothetical protein ACOX2Q_03680 [Dehalobacterium sp.]
MVPSVPSIENYFQSLPPTPINVGLFVGYKNLRNQVGVTPEELVDESALEIMQENLARGMAEGAFGLSVGLEYYPQHRGTKEEMIALCQVLRERGGFYSTHIRNENHHVIPALKEAIAIGLTAGVPVQYSHVKSSRREKLGKDAPIAVHDEGCGLCGFGYYRRCLPRIPFPASM